MRLNSLMTASALPVIAFAAPDAASGAGAGKASGKEAPAPDPVALELADLKAQLAAANDALKAKDAQLETVMNTTDDQLDAMSKDIDALKAELKAREAAAVEKLLTATDLSAGAFPESKLSNAKADAVKDKEMYALERGYDGSRIIEAGEKFTFSGVPGMWMIPADHPDAKDILTGVKERNASIYMGQAKNLV